MLVGDSKSLCSGTATVTSKVAQEDEIFAAVGEAGGGGKEPILRLRSLNLGHGNSRSSSPNTLPQNHWSSILNPVSASHSTPAKTILAVSRPLSGKSTLVSILLLKLPADAIKGEPRTDLA